MASKTKRQHTKGHPLGKRGVVKTFLPAAGKMKNRRASRVRSY